MDTLSKEDDATRNYRDDDRKGSRCLSIVTVEQLSLESSCSWRRLW